MKNLFGLLLCLTQAITFPAMAQTSLIEVSGVVSGTWNSDTVLVTGDLEVGAGTLLTIDPGTLVLFTGQFTFTVKGSIVAIGSASDTIRFSMNDTTGFSDTLSGRGGWHGFVYEHLAQGADSSVFEYCQFQDGKAFSADTFGQYGGAFRVFDFNKITFSHCTFSTNMAIRWGGAVYARNSDLHFDQCTFSGNRCGLAVLPWGYGGGLCSVHSEPVVTNCIFDGNSATGFGGGASFEYSDPEVHFNIFTDNTGGLAGGFGFLRSTPTRVVSNNLVYGNTARFFGGGVACIRSNTIISNLTVTGNHSAYGGGFYCNDSAVPVVYNTILRNNDGFGHEVYIWDVRSAPSFLFCNVEDSTSDFEGSGAHEGYHGTYENNIDSDALFRNTGDQPYALLPGSPCIDAGTPDTAGLQLPVTDMEGLSRIYNDRIDIGAFEWNPGQGLIYPGRNNVVLNAFPNPATDKVSFQFVAQDGFDGHLQIFSVTGEMVMDLQTLQNRQRLNSVIWDLRDLQGHKVTPGIYVCKAENATCRVIVY
jgi:hypothetical protein